MVASYNGWKASQSPAEIGVAPFAVNGVSFPSGVRGGDVGTAFHYLAEQFHKRVEPLITPGCWGYYYKQSANSAALLSCHSSGTAIDFNAPKHPNGKRGTFTAAQVAAIRAILAELGGVVYWGGDAWGNGTPDEMHFEIKTGVTEAQVAAVANKIRSTTQEDPMAADSLSQGVQNQISVIVKNWVEKVLQESPLVNWTGTANQNTSVTQQLRANAEGLAMCVGEVRGLREVISQQASNGGAVVDLDAVFKAAQDGARSIVQDLRVVPGTDA